jgi:hypothetical protein
MELSSEKEREIVRALTDPAHPWMRDHISFALQTISELCQCSTEEAKETLNQIYVERGLVEAVSNSGSDVSSTSWKWRVKRR